MSFRVTMCNYQHRKKVVTDAGTHQHLDTLRTDQCPREAVDLTVTVSSHSDEDINRHSLGQEFVYACICLCVCVCALQIGSTNGR